MALHTFSEGFPPGWEETGGHAHLTGATGQLGNDPLSSTQPDEPVEEVVGLLDSSSDCMCDPITGVEEHARDNVGPGTPEEPKET